MFVSVLVVVLRNDVTSSILNVVDPHFFQENRPQQQQSWEVFLLRVFVVMVFVVMVFVVVVGVVVLGVVVVCVAGVVVVNCLFLCLSRGRVSLLHSFSPPRQRRSGGTIAVTHTAHGMVGAVAPLG